jgi:hypothetical protein
MADLERIVQFSPAFDKRDPDPKKDYGVGCVKLNMVVKGPNGAVNFCVQTGWFLPSVIANWKLSGMWCSSLEPLPSDLSWHSLTPQYAGHEQSKEACAWLGYGVHCYCSSTIVGAQPVFDLMLIGGSEAVWRRLEEEYERCLAIL